MFVYVVYCCAGNSSAASVLHTRVAAWEGHTSYTCMYIYTAAVHHNIRQICVQQRIILLCVDGDEVGGGAHTHNMISYTQQFIVVYTIHVYTN